MKSIRVYQTGPPEVMRLKEAEDPRPGRGEVLIRVKAAGVNPVDTYVRAGIHGYHPELPYTPGADAAGIVEAVGVGVRRIKRGDRVYGARSITGSYAEKAIFAQVHVHPLPKNLTFSQGAAIGIPYVTAYGALFLRAKVRKGQTVLIHGASGGAGIAALQLAREAGLRILATAGSERGRQLLKQQGAHAILNHRDPGHFDEIMKLTRGKGVDVILEMLANENLGSDLKVLANFGRVVVIGSRGTVEIDPRDAMFRDASILGMRLRNLSKEDFLKIHRFLGKGFKKGRLRPVVGRAFPLEKAAEAHRAVLKPPAYGKIVLIP